MLFLMNNHVLDTGKRTVFRRYLRLAIPAAILTGVVAWAAPQIPAWQRMARLKDSNPETRAEAARKLGGRRNYIARDEIRNLITNDPDSKVRAAAVYAAVRLKDTDAVPLIQQTILAHPEMNDDYAARMIADLAVLGGDRPDIQNTLKQCSGAPQVFWQIGAAMAQVEAYQREGVHRLLALASQATPESQYFIQTQLKNYLNPVFRMLGAPMTVGDIADGSTRQAIDDWWRENGHGRLLKDALGYQLKRDQAVHMVERLEHARLSVGKLLGLL